MVERLCRATNAHDLDALVACFAEDYRNETPVPPNEASRTRTGPQNWQVIFSVIRDVHAEVLHVAVDGDTVWSEWEHRGHAARRLANVIAAS